jgi:hypothetical protein
MSLKSSILSLPAGVSPIFISMNTIGRAGVAISIEGILILETEGGKFLSLVSSFGNQTNNLCLSLYHHPCDSRQMSYFLPHLPSGWHVDEAIKSEEDRVVVIRFGRDGDDQCMKMDETLFGVAEKVQNFAVIYLVDITEVPDFNKVRIFFDSARLMTESLSDLWQMYELYDPCTVMFFYRWAQSSLSCFIITYTITP